MARRLARYRIPLAARRKARRALLAQPSVRDGLSRRSVLRGLLGGTAVALGLPPLEAFFNSSGTAYANDAAIARRFGIFFWGNGNRPELWTPNGSGFEWELSTQLTPLKNVKDVITVVTGLEVKVPNDVPHSSGAAGLLSGMPIQMDGDNETFAGPTIDQIVAEAIGSDTLYSSLQTAATDANGVSYNGPNSQNPPEIDPYAFYDRLFGPTFIEPGGEGIVDPSLGLRRSVLDAVMDDIGALNKRVGAADAIRLEQHFDGLRELEERLAKLQEDPPDLEACIRPSEPLTAYPDVDGRPQISARSRAMCDMLAMATACDQTRVFSHYLTDPVSEVLFEGASAGHHSLTHDEPGDQPEVQEITLQCITELAYMIEAFQSIQEGDGTLLDSCVLLGCSEVSLGQTHDLADMPIVIGGNACGTLHSGYHHASPGESTSKLMLTLMRAVGMIVADFGVDDNYETDGLSGIEV